MRTQRKSKRGTAIWITWTLTLCCFASQTSGHSGTPENAALLYYQACIARSGLPLPRGLDPVLKGADPDDEMKKLLSEESYRLVIELTIAATRIRDCDWGLWVSGHWSPGGVLDHCPESLGRILSAHATVLAANGQYSEAVAVVAAMRRLSRHIGDATYLMWVSSVTVDNLAFGVAQYVLRTMPLDIDLLSRIESGLSHDKGPQWHARETLTRWYEMELASLRSLIRQRADWREALIAELETYSMGKDGTAKRLIRSATEPEQIIDHVEGVYKQFLDSAIVTIESDQSYQAKQEQIAGLRERVIADIQAGDVIALVAGAIGPIEAYYRLHINRLALARAVQAAISVYRIKATTGQLPMSLPTGLPEDPYSGQDFQYHVTDEGFSLSCRAPAAEWGIDNEPRSFDFKIP